MQRVCGVQSVQPVAKPSLGLRQTPSLLSKWSKAASKSWSGAPLTLAALGDLAR